jgi:hypothetical protein
VLNYGEYNRKGGLPMATKAKKPEVKKEAPKNAAKEATPATPAAKPKRPQQTFLDECAG